MVERPKHIPRMDEEPDFDLIGPDESNGSDGVRSVGDLYDLRFRVVEMPDAVFGHEYPQEERRIKEEAKGRAGAETDPPREPSINLDPRHPVERSLHPHGSSREELIVDSVDPDEQ